MAMEKWTYNFCKDVLKVTLKHLRSVNMFPEKMVIAEIVRHNICLCLDLKSQCVVEVVNDTGLREAYSKVLNKYVKRDLSDDEKATIARICCESCKALLEDKKNG